jgi:hypothetical protein
VADLAPAALRTRVFALYTVWLTLPGGIMPAVGEAVARRIGHLPLFGATAAILAAALAVVRRLPETLPELPERVATSWSLGRAAPPVLGGGLIVGYVFGVSSVFVPVAPIAEAPGRVGGFFFAYFVGLFGMRLANGMGLAWVARPAILGPAYAFMAFGLAACSGSSHKAKSTTAPADEDAASAAERRLQRHLLEMEMSDPGTRQMAAARIAMLPPGPHMRSQVRKLSGAITVSRAIRSMVFMCISGLWPVTPM